jgi:FOG: CheY-like receiver
VVTPLLQSREGEFNFILSERASPLDVEYDADTVFREGGLSPQKIIGTADGEKLKPLRGLEESLKVGKALLRGSAPAEATPASLNLGLGRPAEGARTAEPPPPPPPEPTPAPVFPSAAAEAPFDNVVPFRGAESESGSFSPVPDEPFPDSPLFPAAAAPTPPPVASSPSRGANSGRFKVAGGLIEVESPEASQRNVVLFESNPLIRVSARRAFGKLGVKIAQFGSLDDVRAAITALLSTNSYFVTFLERTDASEQVLTQLKRRNPRLPVVMIDADADLRRRHDLLEKGTDLYLTKPSPARLQPGLAEEELRLFADELVLFAGRAFGQWEQFAGGFDPAAGKRFYEEAEKETTERSFGVLKQLINELSDPNDVGEVGATILRLAEGYLDRGALFVATGKEFAGLGGFGLTVDSPPMDARVRALRIPRGQPSLLEDVALSGHSHRGKMRKTPLNVELIQAMGGLLPTEVTALPIMHGDRAIGILYGDNAEHRAPIENVAGLEIFLSQAGYAFGNAVAASERGAGER